VEEGIGQRDHRSSLCGGTAAAMWGGASGRGSHQALPYATPALSILSELMDSTGNNPITSFLNEETEAWKGLRL
jgi:hypothetical protein